MEIINEKPIMVFAREYNNKMYYKLGLSKKDRNNNYINGYIECNFKKGVSIADKTKIIIKKGWVDFYLKDKQTIPVIFISEFEIEKEESIQNGDDPFEKFGTSISAKEIDDLDLPF